jgi:hypothetical protein
MAETKILLTGATGYMYVNEILHHAMSLNLTSRPEVARFWPVFRHRPTLC